jgi:hypothetical protein
MSKKRNPQFHNPYETHPQWISGDVSRLISRVPTDEYNLVNGISPGKGAQQIVINLLISKLNNELRKRNITTFVEQELFEDFVSRCELILPEERLLGAVRQGIELKRDELERSRVSGSTAENVVPKAMRRDDGRGASQSPGKDKSNAEHPAKIQGGSGSGSKRRGKAEQD